MIDVNLELWQLCKSFSESIKYIQEYTDMEFNISTGNTYGKRNLQ